MASASSSTSRSDRARAALLLIGGLGVIAAASTWAAGDGREAGPLMKPELDSQEHGVASDTLEGLPSRRTTMVSPPGNSLEGATARLAAAVREGHGAPAAAADLRRLLRTDAGARTACRHLLVRGRLESPVRAALALVFGTVQSPETDPALLEALVAHGTEPLVVVAVLHALGAARTPPDEDDVFDLADRPWGVAGPGGLGITVSRPIEDATVVRVLKTHLWDRSLPPAARAAAVASLRHSLARPEVLADFRAVLEQESVDHVAIGVGEALAVWARGHRGVEGTAVTRELVAKSGSPFFDGFRFHLENEMRGLELDRVAVDTLADYLAPGHRFALRSWALEVLGQQPGVAVTRRLCEIATQDHDAALRDAAVRLLGGRRIDESVRKTLSRIALRDDAWQVRYAALDSLANLPRATILPVLRSALADLDARVRVRAETLLALD